MYHKLYYFKQQDAKDIYQEEYNDLMLDKLTLSGNTNSDLSLNDNTNNTVDKLLLNNQEPVPSLNNFVKKINIDKEQKIIPTQKIANIQDPSFRTKGIKKNNINII